MERRFEIGRGSDSMCVELNDDVAALQSGFHACAAELHLGNQHASLLLAIEQLGELGI